MVLSKAITVLCLLTFALITATVAAQGCKYRGPGQLVPPELDPDPRAVAAAAGGFPIGPDLSTWQFWWEINKDRFLHDGRVRARGPRPAAKDIEGRILPALEAALRKGGKPEIQSACLVALAKIGRTYQRPRLRALFLEFVPSRSARVRESAVLALGIARMEEALLQLESIAKATPRARTLLGRPSVADRTRAFACYALGLIAERSEGVSVKQRVLRALGKARQGVEKNPEADIAAIRSMVLLNIPPTKRTAGEVELFEDVLRELNPLRVVVERERDFANAHVLPTAAMLIGRGDGEVHRKLEAAIVSHLQPRLPHADLHRAAVIALGQLARPAETNPKDEECSAALRRYYAEGRDAQSRYLALISAGQIGGATNRAFLMQVLAKGNKALERPWAALALGVMERRRLDADVKMNPDAEIGALLLEQLEAVKNPASRSAFAVALGLGRYEPAAPSLIEYLHRYRMQDNFGGYLCTSLALMGHIPAAKLLAGIVREDIRRPYFLVQAAVAAARLGAPGSSKVMAEALGRSPAHVVTAFALAESLGILGDPDSIAPLVELLGNPEAETVSRTCAAIALGGIADEERPFHWKIASDLNYRAMVTSLVYRGTGILEIQ